MAKRVKNSYRGLVSDKKTSLVKDVIIEKSGFKKRKTRKPLIVAMAGLAGSGKSSVARALAGHVGAVVISADDIRIELRKRGEHYGRTRTIAEQAAREILERGGNVVLDSDFVESEKRASLRKNAQITGARVVFVRVHCNPDVAIGRIISTRECGNTNDFFAGASSAWKGSVESREATVKIREMWRRTPLHYRWSEKGGGKWLLKKLPFACLAEIDTTKAAWKRTVEKCANMLLLQG